MTEEHTEEEHHGLHPKVEALLDLAVYIAYDDFETDPVKIKEQRDLYIRKANQVIAIIEEEEDGDKEV